MKYRKVIPGIAYDHAAQSIETVDDDHVRHFHEAAWTPKFYPHFLEAAAPFH